MIWINQPFTRLVSSCHRHLGTNYQHKLLSLWLLSGGARNSGKKPSVSIYKKQGVTSLGSWIMMKTEGVSSGRKQTGVCSALKPHWKGYLWHQAASKSRPAQHPQIEKIWRGILNGNGLIFHLSIDSCCHCRRFHLRASRLCEGMRWRYCSLNLAHPRQSTVH